MTHFDTPVDTLARDASAAVHRAVANRPVPESPTPVFPALFDALRVAGYATAGAVAAVAILIGLVVLQQEPIEPVTGTTATTPTVPVTTTLPAPTAPDATENVVPFPDGEADAKADPVVRSGAVPLEDAEPPLLTVTAPADGDHVGVEVITFSGTTDPGARVTASGRYDAAVGADGSWSVVLVLAPGPNGVVFVATDADGNETEVRMVVHRDSDGDTTDGRGGDDGRDRRWDRKWTRPVWGKGG